MKLTERFPVEMCQGSPLKDALFVSAPRSATANKSRAGERWRRLLLVLNVAVGVEDDFGFVGWKILLLEENG